MKKRPQRQRLQRINIVQPNAPTWELVVVELDPYTLLRLDALTARVRAGDIPPSMAKHLSSTGNVQVESPPQRTKRTAVKKIVLATLSLLMISGCVAPIDMDTLFNDDSAPLTSSPDAGHDAAPDAPAPAMDAGHDAAPMPDTPECFPMVWIHGAVPADYQCPGTMVVCLDAPALADGSTAHMAPDGCYVSLPWYGTATMSHASPVCCPAQ
jgi:hypothetical protein